jgi:hypothetical protein
MVLPTVDGDRLSGLKEFKLKRCLNHLGFVMNLDWACSVDNRDRSKTANTSPSTTTQSNAMTPDDESNPAPNNKLKEVNVRVRLNGKLNRAYRTSATTKVPTDVLDKIAIEAQPIQSKKYVANHHFHPEVLQTMMDQGKLNIDCIPVQFIKDLDLVGKGYTDEDLFEGSPPKGIEGPVYVPTPSYKNAKDDYKLVSTRWRLNKMIESCRVQHGGKLTPRGEDDILLPVQKRILTPIQKRGKVDALPDMDTDSNKDLRRAICMLSDDLDEANAEINRLKDEIILLRKIWRGGEAHIQTDKSTPTIGMLSLSPRSRMISLRICDNEVSTA